eukprot:NODE_6172_length_526_cov_37.360587_g5409_i0.p3 GENE.NODE_6172_length_526_cov_37.360587_g5409_i0~~NODE_6172_length_526_cov_37.360587_g5409_i0.p3  ORF type:complete len:56 (+),score=17.54 NODE_6172_length_526_cov_37.360587_g5409_i0:251-418(+)
MLMFPSLSYLAISRKLGQSFVVEQVAAVMLFVFGMSVTVLGLLFTTMDIYHGKIQ